MTEPANDEQEDNYPTVYGLERLRRGRRAINHARYLNTLPGSRTEAEAKARSALGVLRSAMDWLEDTEHFDTAHHELDDAGAFTRRTFGCSLTLEGNTYFQECPVALAHNRVGMSPAIVVKRAECSICHKDPEDCPHIKGRVYDGERFVRVIAEIGEILEISLVGRPAQPDARIHKMSMSTSELQAALGPSFHIGVPVNCDRCLTDCEGVARPFETSEHPGSL